MVFVVFKENCMHIIYNVVGFHGNMNLFNPHFHGYRHVESLALVIFILLDLKRITFLWYIMLLVSIVTCLIFHFQGNGYMLSLESLDDLGLGDLRERIVEIVRKMKEVKIDDNEYTCLKFLILLNPGKLH